MKGIKGLNLNALTKRAPIPAARSIPTPSREAEQIVEAETRMADAVIAASDAVINSTPMGAPTVEQPSEKNISESDNKLSRLIDDDFPFDDSQLAAVYGLVQEKHGCLIGAAGTGKTTVTKKFVDLLRDSLDMIDVSQYWKRGPVDEKDDYEIPERLIPNILICGFTGRSTQMIKKNFPRDWHPNIMTIHRALGFYPEFYEDWDADSNSMVNKRRFVPAYTAENQMPWDVIIVDEAGMLGLDLWHQLWAAIKRGARVYFIGDIQQLPPTHGKSILGFALANWPTWELTHVHRQQGANNSIVDNAHRVLKGLAPVSDLPDLSFKTPQKMVESLTALVRDDKWRFAVIDIDDDHRVASQRIRQGLKLLQNKIYEPNRDAVITPINGFEQTAPGYSLGQAPMNQELVVMLNSDEPRYLIDAGRERQNFALGDKVMATVNDYDAGITNGMTGIIVGLERNGAYLGNTRAFGLISEVNEYYDSIEEEEEDVEFCLDDMVSDSQAGLAAAKDKEKRDGGPASHIITVRFGEDDHAFEIPFASKSAVASLMLAYVATCHKMQGGEAPLVFVIVHQTNKRMLNREWLYTAITRASGRCVLLMTRQGRGFALGKQNIKGVTLEQKIKTFTALTESGLLGPTVKVKLPPKESLRTDVVPYTPAPKEVFLHESQTQPQHEKPAAEAEPARETHVHITIKNVNIRVDSTPAHRDVADSGDRAVDGGELKSESISDEEYRDAKKARFGLAYSMGLPKRIEHAPAAFKLVSQWGAIHMKLHLDAAKQGPLLLTHQPAPAPVKPVNKLALLLAHQKKG